MEKFSAHELEMLAYLDEELAFHCAFSNATQQAFLEAHELAFAFGRSVQRIEDSQRRRRFLAFIYRKLSDRLFGFMFCAFSGFVMGILVAALMHSLHGE